MTCRELTPNMPEAVAFLSMAATPCQNTVSNAIPFFSVKTPTIRRRHQHLNVKFIYIKKKTANEHINWRQSAILNSYKTTAVRSYSGPLCFPCVVYRIEKRKVRSCMVVRFTKHRLIWKNCVGYIHTYIGSSFVCGS